MKKITKPIIVFIAAMCVLMVSCVRGYDSTECDRLALKVATSSDLSQDDYKSMIDQSGHMLSDLIKVVDEANAASRAKDPDSTRTAFRDDPAFMQRLDYMFTFSSVLYRAHLAGALNAENNAAYEALDSRSDRFARLCSAL